MRPSELLHSKDCVIIKLREIGMAKGEQKGNRESKKPKKEKIKTIAAAPRPQDGNRASVRAKRNSDAVATVGT
jgi:hypothetical protein